MSSPKPVPTSSQVSEELTERMSLDVLDVLGFTENSEKDKERVDLKTDHKAQSGIRNVPDIRDNGTTRDTNAAQITTGQTTAGILDRPCGSCGRRQPAMVEMAGGPRDPRPWWLCGACYGTPQPRQAPRLPDAAPERPRAPARAQRGLGLATGKRGEAVHG